MNRSIYLAMALLTVPVSQVRGQVVEDVTPPSLLGMFLDPTSIDITASSQPVAVTWHVMDDLAGLPGPASSSPTQMRLRSPSGKQFVDSVLSKSDLVSGNLLDGVFRDTITFPRYSETGIWRPEHALLVDTIGNMRYLYPADLISQGLDIGVTVAGTADLAPPSLLTVSLDRIAIDTSASDQPVAVTWHVADDLSGVFGPGRSSPTQMRFRSPSGKQFVDSVLSTSDLVSGNLLDGVFRDTITFPRYSETGTWRPEYAMMVDTIGNMQYLYPADLVSQGLDIEVTLNGIADIQPPSLLEASLDRTYIDTSASNQTVGVTWHVADDLSGLFGSGRGSPTQMRFRSPSGKQFVDSVLSMRDLVSGDLLDGVFRDTITFPRYSETGIWRPEYALMVDTIGNMQYLHPADLISQGLDISLVVGIESEPGDADRDGDVDIFDVAVLQANYGTASGATWTEGDFDGNGSVDIFDVALMQPNYGHGTSSSPAAVPEPSSVMLAVTGLACLVLCAKLCRRQR
ncbi:MAG: dockerin type I domain-containing protein [Pirellulales bacterium]